MTREPKFLEPRLEDSRRLQQMQDEYGYIVVGLMYPLQPGERFDMITRPGAEKHEGICNMIAIGPATFEEFQSQTNRWFDRPFAELEKFRDFHFYKTKAE